MSSGVVKANYDQMQEVADRLKKAPDSLIPNFQEVVGMVKADADDTNSEALGARYREITELQRAKVEPAAVILANIGKAIETEIASLRNADRA